MPSQCSGDDPIRRTERKPERTAGRYLRAPEWLPIRPREPDVKSRGGSVPRDDRSESHTYKRKRQYHIRQAAFIKFQYPANGKLTPDIN